MITEFLKRHKTSIFLLLLLMIGALLRFYNLNWGAPFYFHPDERNIASSISQMSFPDNLNPKFFAYGSLPLYLTFFLGIGVNVLTTCEFSLPCTVSFEQAIIITRILSAALSTLLILLAFFTAEKVKRGAGLPVALLCVFSTGFIQFAHFGTVEMWLTFFTLLLLFVLLKIISKPSILFTLLAGCILGILISTKVSSAPLFILPVLALFLQNSRSLKQRIIQTAGNTILMILVTSLLFLLTNPYIFLDTTSFLGSMQYESSVALGTLPVFYTGEFVRTLPILFQFTSIYPFLLNPFLTILFIPALLMLIPSFRKNKQLLLVLAFFLVTFLSQSFVYVKWTRYMLPTLPFIYLLIVYWAQQTTKLRTAIISLMVVMSIVFSLSYTITAFVEDDTRISAAAYAKTVIPPSAPILSEVYDLGIVPFNDSFSAITLFNTYELDNHNPEYSWKTLQHALSTNEYIILPSQRVLKTRILDEKSFPIGNRFYKDLVDGKTNYQPIYQTPCSLFCRITYLGDPVFQFEGTTSVFDHPTVFIYKKI